MEVEVGIFDKIKYFYNIYQKLIIIQRLQIQWTAPPPGRGCVTFRATVIEHRDLWYKDDGLLTKDFCEDDEVQDDIISKMLPSCNACHEAKYEVLMNDFKKYIQKLYYFFVNFS